MAIEDILEQVAASRAALADETTKRAAFEAAQKASKAAGSALLNHDPQGLFGLACAADCDLKKILQNRIDLMSQAAVGEKFYTQDEKDHLDRWAAAAQAVLDNWTSIEDA